MSILNTIRRTLFWVLSLSVALISWRFMVGGVEATMEFVAYHAVERKLAFFAHITLAPVALALLPFQFWTGLRARRPSVHRWIGRIYGVAILLAGLGGLAMAVGTEAGTVAAFGFGGLAVSWLGTTAWGIWQATQRNIVAHRRWMIRAAALTLSAVTLRLYTPILGTIMGLEEGYALVAWLCWVPNLIVAEWVLRRKPRRAAMVAA